MLFKVEFDPEEENVTFVVKSPLSKSCAQDLIAVTLTSLAKTQIKSVILDVAGADPVAVDAIQALNKFHADLQNYDTWICFKSPSEETRQLLEAMNSLLMIDEA